MSTQPGATVEAAGIDDPGKAWRAARGIPVVPAWDGYRTIGTFGVALFHIFQVAGVYAAVGGSALGVVLWGALPSSIVIFFVVSGFVLYLPTVSRDGDFGDVGGFALRRAARVLPAYWVCIGIALLLLGTVSGSGGLPGAGPIAAHVAGLQTPALLFVPNFPLGFGVINPVWSLSVEFSFYVILPFIAAWYYRRPFVGLLCGALIVVAWHVASVNADGLASAFGIDLSASAATRIDANYASQLPSYAVAFAAGMTGAWLYVRIRDSWPAAVVERLAVRVAAASLLAVAFFIYLAGRHAIDSGYVLRQSLPVSVGFPLALATALVALSLAPRWAQRPFTNAPIRWVADITYGVFLIHVAVIWYASRELSLPTDGSLGAIAAWSAIVFTASLAYAYLSSRLLERPIRRWAHRYRRGDRREAATAPST
jgi:acetyltransferase